MSISRINVGGWGVGEKFSSGQLNQIDINTTRALDRRPGQADTLGSIVSLSGAGRIIPTIASGADGNTTYQIDGGNLVVRVTATVTGNRTYTLSPTNALDGDEITFYCEPSFNYEATIKDTSSRTLFVIGNLDSSDGQWVSCIFSSGVWIPFRLGQASRTRAVVFDRNGTFVRPRGITWADILGTGAGGGGGGGGGAGIGAPLPGGGGGGGGGADVRRVSLNLVSDSYPVVVPTTGGIGGQGGGFGMDGTDGGNGADSTFGSGLTFAGAAGGAGGPTGGTGAVFVPGGGPHKLADRYRTNFPSSIPRITVPGYGGWGYHPDFSGASTYPDSTNFGVGACTATSRGGSPGTTPISNSNGGNGGGGAATAWTYGISSPDGAGGNGGNGAAVNVAATPGATPSTSRGAGGGGGGGGRASAGTNGGEGAGGCIVVFYVK